MSREPTANTQLLFPVQPIVFDGDVVNASGEIDNNKLRQYIIQKTGLDANDRFLTDYTNAIEFEFDCIDGEQLIDAIRHLLLRNVSAENFRQFEFKKEPDLMDPFQLDQSAFQEVLNCVEQTSAAAVTVGFGCVGGAAGSGVGLPCAVAGFLLMAVFSPFLALANRAGHLASITNRESFLPAAATWLLTLGGAGGSTYGIYHNLFQYLNQHSHEDLNQDKVKLFFCHLLCVYICAAVFAAGVALVGKVSDKLEIDRRFPSEKFSQLIDQLKQVGENLAPREADPLQDTNLAQFLFEARKKGGKYEQAAKFVIEAHLLSLNKGHSQSAVVNVSPSP